MAVCFLFKIHTTLTKIAAFWTNFSALHYKTYIINKGTNTATVFIVAVFLFLILFVKIVLQALVTVLVDNVNYIAVIIFL